MKIFKSLGHCISWGKGRQANRDSFHITGLKKLVYEFITDLLFASKCL